jgi:3-oxoacyl-[acyl-carrier-protein] synthase II
VVTTEVQVTGLAWATALGSTTEAVWRSLLGGATGIRTVASAHALRNDRAATVPGLDPHLAPADRQHRLARDTLAAALADAGIPASHPGLHAVLGTSYGAHLDDPAGAPLDAWCRRVAADLGLTRLPLPVSTACSSGSDSVLAGAELIRGGADVVVCGAADVLTTAKRLGHSALGTMSPTTLRAFDADRDGTILGEGAGFLVLEPAAAARARDARAYGRLLGAGSANDATGATTPDPSGDTVVRAVERALAVAGRDARDVSTVNAHGSGTPVNDDVESRSLARLFPGGAGPTVFATKGALGHSLGATGTVEAIAVLLALRDRVVPPVAGLRTVMPGFPLPLPAGRPAPIGAGVGLSVTLGFGGFNTCLAFGAVR